MSDIDNVLEGTLMSTPEALDRPFSALLDWLASKPACQAGAIPAVGSLSGLTTYADFAVRDDPEVSFNAGSHRFSARVDRASWERACGAVYADLAEIDSEPAWARS